jgi:hypothetical protein
MENQIKLIQQAINNNNLLVWNDPDPIKRNDYTISYIEKLDEDHDEHTPILIKYNNGKSEAEVFAHEILILNK